MPSHQAEAKRFTTMVSSEDLSGPDSALRSRLADNQPAGERQAAELQVEAVAVLVRPGGAVWVQEALSPSPSTT